MSEESDLQSVLSVKDWTTVDTHFLKQRMLGTTWYRIEIANTAAAKTSWHLVVDAIRVDEVELYARPSGQEWSQQKAGGRIHRSVWPLQGRVPTFALDLEPGKHTFFLRVKGPQHWFLETAEIRSVPFNLALTGKEALMFGGTLALCLLIVVAQMVLWGYTRDHTFGGHALYSLALLFTLAASSGYWQLLVDFSSDTIVKLTGVALCVGYFHIARFSAGWLNLRKLSARLDRWHLAVALVITLVACAVVLMGRFEEGLNVTRMLLLVSWPLYFVWALWLWNRQWPGAKSYVLLFWIVDIGGLLRLLRNMGVVPQQFVPDELLLVVLVVHLLSVGIYLLYRQIALGRLLAQERLRREEQNDFVQMVSHEFRTPLAIINTTAQVISAQPDMPQDKLAERITNIREATKRLTSLLDDYLSVARMDSVYQPVKLDACDFYEIVEEATSDWPLERIRIEGKPCPSSWVCDSSLITIALRNLLANADRHSPASALITLRIGGDLAHALEVEVSDQGDGIADDEIHRIYSKYFRGRDTHNQPGAGLGLYLVKKIIHAHHGSISCMSTLGQGTTFRISLPALAKR